MRVHLKTDARNILIPFEHQHLLTGTIYKWLGWNNEHGELSLYSYSWLEGGRKTGSGLQFDNGASFFFSSHSRQLIGRLIYGVQSEPAMFRGLEISEIVVQEDPDLTHRDRFFTASPVFIKRRVDDRIDHILYDDPRANACLKETVTTKLKKAGVEDASFDIRFDTEYPKAGTKLINYKGIGNKASWCPVFIEGRPETKVFIWNVGLGNSTGIGFGAIK